MLATGQALGNEAPSNHHHRDQPSSGITWPWSSFFSELYDRRRFSFNPWACYTWFLSRSLSDRNWAKVLPNEYSAWHEQTINHCTCETNSKRKREQEQWRPHIWRIQHKHLKPREWQSKRARLQLQYEISEKGGSRGPQSIEDEDQAVWRAYDILLEANLTIADIA